MIIELIGHYEEIIDRKDISELLGTLLMNPSYGKIQNIAQGIYAKTQGRFYIASDSGQLVGLMGFSKIDNNKLVVRHMAVSSGYNRQKIAEAILTEAIKSERVSIVTSEPGDEDVSFYKSYGFSVKKRVYDDAVGQKYDCVYTVN
ncbi:GNAT family N-acetyltransferase [Fusibacter bizertensis]|uniref:GNAT family N-acetyltransferase n=1 Tax=Fusibacter bizertensis TaxID=1488331 RepID=A0ABT6NDD6_9FIRM|nr:GNAT family N-acetyltransferase [Fusibacter bizertensis]MDH8678385.1 GNAT family N-acetyltransferase [Fusibacter bizertensis]